MSELQERLTASRAAQAQETTLAKREDKPRAVADLFSNDRFRQEMANTLNDERMMQRYVNLALTIATRELPDLLKCTYQSFAGALLQCAMTRLEPGRPLGLAWILPFKDNKTDTLIATFVMGYPGVVQLAMRPGLLGDIAAHAVHENDDFEFDLGANYVHHRWSLHVPRGAAYAYYAVARYANGGRHIHVMSIAEVQEHRSRYARSGKSPSSPWRTEFDKMAQKTCLLQMRHYLPASTEWAQAIAADDRPALWVPGQGVVMADELPEPQVPNRTANSLEAIVAITNVESELLTPEQVMQENLLDGQPSQ